ncbi:MAG: FAD-dependent oxidoreductase [bacterium]
MTIDDEPHVLNAIERDLRANYHSSYRIIKAGSGKEALETMRQLKRRGAPIALFLVDQRMPGMSGTEFLKKTIEFYPEARKVLLTAYADTDAAISSINIIGLDHYLMKPWDPPEQHLYPVLDDLLSDWMATVPAPYDGIRVIGTRWSASSHCTKDFLARNQIPYQWMDIEKDPHAKALVASLGEEDHRLPIVFFPDGSALIDPESGALAEKVGLVTRAKQPFYDLIIVGAGPAGLAASVFGASEGLRTVVIEKQATGGQAGTSARIENYLGFPQGLSGADLARRATAQAKRLGAEILTAQEVVSVRVEDPYRFVTLRDGTELSCHALLISTGMTVRRPNVPGIDSFMGVSVYYGAAITEAKHYSGGRVLVIGGANSAGQGAIFLSRFASQVTILKRGDSLEAGMSKYLIDQIKGTPNINVMLQTELKQVHGEKWLEAVTIQNRATDNVEKVPAEAVFIFIGATPHSHIISDVVELSEDGFILTGPDLITGGRRPKSWRLRRDPYLMETSVPGIFAAGDVRHDVVRRVASAVGQGSVAVSLVQKYLETV